MYSVCSDQSYEYNFDDDMNNQDGGNRYPLINEDNFSGKIAKIFHKNKISDIKPSMKEICFPKKYTAQKPQVFVSEYINPKTPYKGLLINHKIGAGKTCASIKIAEKWKGKRKIYVVLPASLIGGYRDELRTLCVEDNKYMTNEERTLIKQIEPSSDLYKEIIERTNKRIDKVYNICSYNKFIKNIQEKKISLKKSLLIIDEIQNLISETGTYYETLSEFINKAPEDLRIVVMSATPMFDKPHEIALLMNLLRMPKSLPTGDDFYKKFVKNVHKKDKYGNDILMYEAKNLDMFKKMIKGYVSYYTGAPDYVFPETNVKYVKCTMSDFQHKAYKDIIKNEASGLHMFDESQDVMDLPNNFFIGTRIVSNIVFPNKKVGEDGLSSLTKNIILNNLEKYSVKIHKMMKKINQKDKKICIYSSFKEYGGLKTISCVLEAHGYKNYFDHGVGRKRYVVWSGDENIAQKQEIKAAYNDIDNLRGNKIKVILLSPSGKEGLSLFGVRQIHILEPYWNMSRIEQIIGRGSRYCSHKDLTKEDRTLDAYIYLSVHDSEQTTIDQYMKFIALRKKALITEFEQAIKEIAVDCELNKNSNKEKYQCT